VKKKTRVWILMVVAVALLESGALYILRPSAGRWRSEAVVKDEPPAHALYDQMIAALRNADSLSYRCSSSAPGQRAEHYQIWLKKPNYFRVEAINAGGSLTGTLVGDGARLWVYWPGDCPLIDPEDTNIPREQWPTFYRTRPTGVGRHSIAHDVLDLGRGMHMPFIDPSTFHGYTDSLQPYLDGVASRGTDKVGQEQCDVIEVCFMNAQRSWYLWLSQRDHLPRRAKQILRGLGTLVDVEVWQDVAVNAGIPAEKFVWSPPQGWRVWTAIDPATKLLKPGQPAPDFTLRALEGGKIKLSDFRDQIVWLYIWRSG
jgi:outer membrane lipoprotein-sorting protein